MGDKITPNTADNAKARKEVRRGYSFYLSENLLSELDAFLQEFGGNKESKSTFIEEAILLLLKERKKQLRDELEKKLKNL